jgi:hypothetical protein
LSREIAEELYLDLSCDVSTFHPLGIFRELYRAGMPQAFFGFRVSLTAEELVERIRDARNSREVVGVLFIRVNRKLLPRLVKTLVRAGQVSEWELGLEAQSLLTAFACQGKDVFFP